MKSICLALIISCFATGVASAQDARISARLVRTISHSDLGRDVALTTDGQHLITSSVDKTVKIWRLSDGVLVRTIAQPEAVALTLVR